jgi:hypothetical protein
MWDLLWANLRHLPDPLSRAVWRELYSRAFSANWYALEGQVEAEALRLAREGPDNTLAFLHFPLPHAPFVFEADGRYAGPFEGGRMFGTREEYAQQIRYVDMVVGRFLDTLAAAGRLDSALVIVTSAARPAPHALGVMEPSDTCGSSAAPARAHERGGSGDAPAFTKRVRSRSIRRPPAVLSRQETLHGPHGPSQADAADPR